MTSGPVGDNQQQLRLALAMRGGASMAVWIGGAVAEINHLREALADSEPDERKVEPNPWAALAELAGYESVEVDVLAGASAGGLNATLLSSSIVYGMPFDSMRRTWVRLADLEAMARPVPKLWHRRPQSLLEGDAYFRPELARTITERVPRPDRTHVSRVDMLLTATLLNPVEQRELDGRAEPIVSRRRRAAFRFRHQGRPGHPLSDFGADGELPATAGQLAQAARTTSSFPFAFEPGEVHSAAGDPPPGVPNMYGRFSEVAPPSDPRPFRVIDGGVLDNIPVTAAIRSIADSVADRPVDRWLLYLNPDPDDTPPEHRRRRWFAVPVVSAALRARMGQESLLADIEALHRHNESVQRTNLRRRALFAGLNSTPPPERPRALERCTDAVRDEHALVQAGLDARAVYGLLTEPQEREGTPLLEPVTGDPLEGWSAPARTELWERLSARFTEHARREPDAVFDDARGLLSGVDECLGWAQDVEGRVPVSQAREVGRCKAALYRLRAVGEVLGGHADHYWITGARLEPITQLAELDGWVDRVLGRRRRLQHHLPSPTGPLLGSVLATIEEADDLPGERFQRALSDFAAELSSIVDSSGADAAADDGDHVDAVAEATAVLDRIATRLATAARERDATTEPGEIAYSLLERVRADQRPAVLRRLVVLTAPLDVGRVSGSHIKFLRVVSDARTPLPFDSLRTHGRVRIADKVRGSGMGGFAAFLSAKWRANDWMWGRLDSAASLVPLLVDPARLVRHNAELGAEGLGDALQAVVSRPTRAELGDLDGEQAKRWREFLAERWAAHAGDVRAELDALFERPDGTHPLTETTKIVVERLQWTVAAEEIPFVTAVSSGADPDAEDTTPVPEPRQLATDVRRYDVGRQRLDALGEQRMASVATRFALIAYRAVVPGRDGVLAFLVRCGMTVLKPVVMAVVFALAAPLRAALVAFLAAAGATFGGAVSRFAPVPFDEDVPPGAGASWTVRWSNGSAGEIRTEVTGAPMDRALDATSAISSEGPRAHWFAFFDMSGFSFGDGAYVAAFLAVLAACWLGWQAAGWLSRGHGVARWVPALLAGAALLAGGYWLSTTGFRLGPLGLAVLAVALTWLATFAYRPGGRAVATVLTAVVFGLTLWAAVAWELSVGGWILASVVVCAYAHVLLLSVVDVLRPRPRPGVG